MNTGLRVLITSMVAAGTTAIALSSHAQAARYVQRGGMWVLEAVVQDQVLNRGVYPALNYANRSMEQAAAHSAQYPTVTYSGNYPNSTPAYRYPSPQPMVYGQQVQPQYQQPSYQMQRRVCSNGRQQWYC